MDTEIIEVAHVLPVLEWKDQIILEIHPKYSKLFWETTLSNIWGKCEYLESEDRIETNLECAIRETHEETGIELQYLKKEDFCYFWEVTRTIVWKVFRSEMFLIELSDKEFTKCSKRKDIWTGTLNDFENSSLRSVVDKNEFIEQTKKWLDLRNNKNTKKTAW